MKLSFAQQKVTVQWYVVNRIQDGEENFPRQDGPGRGLLQGRDRRQTGRVLLPVGKIQLQGEPSSLKAGLG